MTDAKQELGHRRTLALRFFRESLEPFRGKCFRFVSVPLFIGAIPFLPVPWILSFEFSQGLTLTQSVRLGAVVTASMLLFVLANTAWNQWLSLMIETYLRQTVLQKVQRVPLSLWEPLPRVEWHITLREDVLGVEKFLSEKLPGQLTHGVLLFASAILFLELAESLLAIVPLGMVFFLAWIWVTVAERITPFRITYRRRQSGLFDFLVESLKGVRTLRSHRAEPFIERKFESKLRLAAMPRARVPMALTAKTSLALPLGFVLLVLSGTEVSFSFCKSQSLASQICYPILLALFFRASLTMASLFRDWRLFLERAFRLETILAERESVTLLPASILKTAGKIVCQNIVIEQGEQHTVGPTDLTIACGEILGVVGPSHSGKSLLLEWLVGVRGFCRGEIVVKSEKDFLLWSAEGKGTKCPLELCAFVEQKPYFFEGTLRENLLFGNPNRLSEAVLWEALEACALGHLLKSNQGLEAVWDGKSPLFSESEKLRLALCRALLLQRPFLVLDEPFAFLDEASVEHVIAILERLCEKKGIVIATQHLPEALSVDSVVLMDRILPRGVSGGAIAHRAKSAPLDRTFSKESRELLFSSVEADRQMRGQGFSVVDEN